MRKHGQRSKNEAEATAVNDLLAAEFTGEEIAGFTEKADIECGAVFQ